MDAAQLAAVLAGYRVLAASEARLQAIFADIAGRENWTVLREHRLSATDIPDFFFPDGGLAVELKTAGRLAAVERQLSRYAAHDAVRALALITTRAVHAGVASPLSGKPVSVIVVSARGAFV